MPKPCCAAAIEADEGTCVFGCGSRVDTDTGVCLICRDHSANAIECECGARWERWGAEYEQTDPPRRQSEPFDFTELADFTLEELL